MKRAFTLLELLVVMGLMGFLGTVTIGGYRAMQRGMEERAVMQNVNTIIRAAYQRAQIDRQPAAIFFWNETRRSRTDLENEIVVGRAVAVRRHGRFSTVNGSFLVDEFADFNQTYPVDGDPLGKDVNERSLKFVYPMDDIMSVGSGFKRSLVQDKVFEQSETVIFLSDVKSEAKGKGQAAPVIPAWGFKLEDAGGVSWHQGMAYGFEFADITLPDNYIFGANFSADIKNPMVKIGTMAFAVGRNTNSGLTKGGSVGMSTIQVSALRQKGGSSLTAVSIGTSDSPEQDL